MQQFIHGAATGDVAGRLGSDVVWFRPTKTVGNCTDHGLGNPHLWTVDEDPSKGQGVFSFMAASPV